MEKGLKIVKTITALLISLLIIAIAFCGVYAKQNGIWNNVLKDVNLGMELEGYRELRFILDSSEEEKEIYVDSEGNYKGTVKEETETTSEEIENTEGNTEEQIEETSNNDVEYKKETRVIKANEDDKINKENFIKSKSIIQKRLETIDSNEYNIRQDLVTGEIVVEVPDNDNLALEEYLISAVAKVEIIDYQTGVVLMTNSNIKKATALGSNTEDGYQAYLQLEFDKNGAEILKEISKKYTKVTNEDGTDTTKYISVLLDGTTIATTYFGEELPGGMIQIPMGKAYEDYNEYIEFAKNVTRFEQVINGNQMPLKYELTADNFVQSSVTREVKILILVVVAIIVFVISIVMIAKFKLNGLKHAIFAIGYIALLTLIVRYTNVLITVNSAIALALVIAINYIFIFKFLNSLKETNNAKKSFGTSLKELYFAIVPVCIIAIVFTFMSSAVINSVGMVVFWGLLVQAMYQGLNYLLDIM